MFIYFIESNVTIRIVSLSRDKKMRVKRKMSKLLFNVVEYLKFKFVIQGQIENWQGHFFHVSGGLGCDQKSVLIDPFPVVVLSLFFLWPDRRPVPGWSWDGGATD